MGETRAKPGKRHGENQEKIMGKIGKKPSGKKQTSRISNKGQKKKKIQELNLGTFFHGCYRSQGSYPWLCSFGNIRFHRAGPFLPGSCWIWGWRWEFHSGAASPAVLTAPLRCWSRRIPEGSKGTLHFWRCSAPWKVISPFPLFPLFPFSSNDFSLLSHSWPQMAGKEVKNPFFWGSFHGKSHLEEITALTKSDLHHKKSDLHIKNLIYRDELSGLWAKIP